MTDVVCRSCGAPTSPEARFCASCGQPLVVRGDERRVITVLFADLVGFTTLAEHRDPESVKNLVDRCFGRLAADIADHGGRVDKIVGDAILALFGAPVAHEDDAERAVRAGLRMQATLAEWAGETGAEALRLRVGVNTGEVLVGALRAGGDWTAMGDVVNTASRLQTIAEPGQVVVGPDTYAATRECVRYTSLGPVRAKGREAPVDVWVAEEAITPPGRRRRRESPLVGRDQEVALLWSVVDSAVRNRRPAAVFVVADAGVGKTRLVQEVASRAAHEHGARVFEGSCVPYGEANVWWPIAEALRSSLGIEPETPADDARERCRQRVSERLAADDGPAEVERVANGLLQLLGLPGHLENIDPARAREEVIRSLATYIERGARRSPAVIVLSDVHWADDVVLELTQTMLERAAGLPIVMLCTARAGLLERWQPPVGRHHLVVTHLDPLDRLAAAELLERLAPGPVAAELRELVLDRSGGNPFFLEELVTLLADGADGSQLPHTLRGLAAARLDALPRSQRKLLEAASILGRRFTKFAIDVMATKTHPDAIRDVDETIDGLVATDLLVADGDAIEFRSELVREVAYGTLTKAERIRGHAGVAGWIERHQSHPGDADRIAHHYATAAVLSADLGPVADVPDDLPQRAVMWLDRALDQAEATDLHVVAIRLTTQGLELVDAASAEMPQRLRFLLSRAKARTALRELDAAEADLELAERLAGLAADPVLLARVQMGRGDLAQKRGQHDASAALVDAAITTFRATDDQRSLAEALLLRGLTDVFGGNDLGAEDYFVEAKQLFCGLSDRRGEAWALQNLAMAAYGSGRIEEADQRCQDSAAIFEELGDEGGLGWALGMLSFVRYHQGRWQEAEELNDLTLGEAIDRADPWATGMMYCLRALLRLWTGRAASALEPAQRGVQYFRRIDDWWGLLMSLGGLARTLIALGRIEEGLAVAEESVAVAAGVPYASAGQIAGMNVAGAAAMAGRPERA
ncbi:MAG: adenylate/guanylate cyclase domain-containing protein, partial [Acidimicrobiales bacterium]